VVDNDDANLLSKSINIIKTKTEALLNPSKKTGIEVSTDKPKYMFMSHDQTTGQIHYIEATNKSFENVAKFKYLGRMVTNQNSINEKVEQNKFKECLVPCCSESFVFPCVIQNYNFTYCSLWA
jgi:hypothetical protein